MIGELAAPWNPRLVLILLHIADHLLEGRRDVGPPAELGMDDDVHGAGPPAQRLLIDEIERGPKTLKVRRGIAEAARPGAPVVGIVEFGNHRDALAAGLRHVGHVVVEGIAEPAITLLRQDAERLRGVQVAGPGPADRPLAGAGLDHAGAVAHLLSLRLGRKIGHVIVVGHAVACDLVAGPVQGLYRVGTLLDREAVGPNGGADLVAIEHVHQPPNADRAAVIGVRQRGHIQLDLRALLEAAALAESLIGDAKGATDELAVGPGQLGLWPLHATMHGKPPVTGEQWTRAGAFATGGSCGILLATKKELGRSACGAARLWGLH